MDSAKVRFLKTQIENLPDPNQYSGPQQVADMLDSILNIVFPMAFGFQPTSSDIYCCSSSIATWLLKINDNKMARQAVMLLPRKIMKKIIITSEWDKKMNNSRYWDRSTRIKAERHAYFSTPIGAVPELNLPEPNSITLINAKECGQATAKMFLNDHKSVKRNGALFFRWAYSIQNDEVLSKTLSGMFQNDETRNYLMRDRLWLWFTTLVKPRIMPR